MARLKRVNDQKREKEKEKKEKRYLGKEKKKRSTGVCRFISRHAMSDNKLPPKVWKSGTAAKQKKRLKQHYC